MNKSLKIFACLALALTYSNVNAQIDFGGILKKSAKKVGETVIENILSDGKNSNNTGKSINYVKNDGKLRVQTQIDGLSVKVKTCDADANGNVILTFTLENQTNKDASTSGFYACDSKANDDEGNQYVGRESSGSPILFSMGNQLDYRYYLDVKLPSGIPVKYKMKIIDVDPAARVLRLVTINLGGSGNWHGNINLHNIPITREGDE